ncbi:thioredoxin family protein [Prochlorococcus sp. MIT 1300]|uniref:thioredoxin family protein n=1 Tax=Prochlorococcus sp. MIT 1300 TaxID=3096218 RepID=UPI002A759F4A|nr:thioredoxin family protein [Prochlorococcus sp. MIT 1300]
MVVTPSTMLPLGTPLPPFELNMVSGTKAFLDGYEEGLASISDVSLRPKPLLLMVLCSHCPFVKHIEDGLTQLDQDYRLRIQMFAIASNSLITHPQDGPEQLAHQVTSHAWHFPYLEDSSQDFVKALRAACTPEFFLFAPSSRAGRQTLRYRGQFDGSRPGNKQLVTGCDLRAAIDAVLENKEVSSDQKPSIGCNIKWHPGQEPPWYG